MSYESDSSGPTFSGSQLNSAGNPVKDCSTEPKAKVGNAPAKSHVCPTCSRTFARKETKVMPFCSIRCQQVDLGRWLNESYGLPYEGSDGPEGFSVADEEW